VYAVGSASSKLTSSGNADRSCGSRADHAEGRDGDDYDLGEGIHVGVGSNLLGWDSPLVGVAGVGGEAKSSF
jgi:hypothetical protein